MTSCKLFPSITKLKRDYVCVWVNYRQALRITRSYFNMVLLDELGVDRERFNNPTTSDELYTYIEEYLLGEEERERLQLNKDLCD